MFLLFLCSLAFMEVGKTQAEPFRSACCFILFPQEKKAPINSSVKLILRFPSFFRHESLHEQYHLQAVFSAQCKITSFPIRAQTPSAPHSGTESRRSTETRTAQSAAASEDSAHGCQFASAAASPSRRHHLGKHAPMCPVRRNAMNRRIRRSDSHAPSISAYVGSSPVRNANAP